VSPLASRVDNDAGNDEVSMAAVKKIRYAVVGLGHIAEEAVLPAFTHARRNSKLEALVSGNPRKLSALGDEYRVPIRVGYDDYERCLEHVDAVYIATPNTEHAEYAVRAARAGVHVLCEKPLAATDADCLRIANACRDADVRAMTAYRLHFEPVTIEVLERVREGAIGEPRFFSATFSMMVKPGNIRTRPDTGGGSVYDLGVYCINAARNIFEAEPISVVANVVERNGTDDMTLAILHFPGDRVAQFCVANSISSVSSYRIAGTDGDLRVEPAYDYVDELVHYLTIDEKTERQRFPRGDQFAPELKYFSDCILNDLEPEPSGEEGFCDVRVVEAILESARIKRAVPLEPYARHRRPTLAQAEHIRPVKKPKTIEAPSPSLK
jgi:predicted dehydrogenase